MKMQAESQNLGGKVMRNCKIIYARTKADVEISASDENFCAYQILGAQVVHLLTIWARQNLQLLTEELSFK
jgi:hypothetical protein